MNIFIGNLSWAITDADLRDLFEEYGDIKSAKVVMDRETGKSRGFGFVELVDEEQAKRAISELNGASYDNKVISVTEARPREERPRDDRRRPFNNNRGGGFNNRREGGDRPRNFDNKERTDRY
ncbi:MAG: RNA recognition motif domain-containing protein [Bacteroidales bacterium]